MFDGIPKTWEIVLYVLYAIITLALIYWVAYLIWYVVYKKRAKKAKKRPTYVYADYMRNFRRFNMVTARKQLPRKQRKYVDKVFIVKALKKPTFAISIIFFIASWVLWVSSGLQIGLYGARISEEGTVLGIISCVLFILLCIAGGYAIYMWGYNIAIQFDEMPQVRMTMDSDVYQSYAYTDVKTAVPETAALAALGITRNDVIDCGAYDFMCRETDEPALIACREDMRDFRTSAYTAVYAFCTTDEICVYTRRHDVVYGTTDEPKIIRERYADINAVKLTEEYRDVQLERYTTIPRKVTRITLDCKDGTTKYFEFDMLNEPTKNLAGMLCRKIDELRADFDPASSTDSISGE